MAKNKTGWNLKNWRLATALGVTGCIIIAGGIDKVLDMCAEENGTIVGKANDELFVDLDGDNKADRVLRLEYLYMGYSYYDYAKLGDKISYNNHDKRDTVQMGFFNNQLKKINGKSLKEIQDWYEMKPHSKTR